jgi:hypothetical protein
VSEETAFDRLNRSWDLRKKTTGFIPGKRGYYALGRAPSNTLNKTEAKYLANVIEPALASGELVWAQSHAITLKLAPNTHLKIDFALLPKDGVLEMVDVKGAKMMFEEDAKAKMKIAAALYPFRFFVTWPIKGGAWEKVEIGG